MKLKSEQWSTWREFKSAQREIISGRRCDGAGLGEARV